MENTSSIVELTEEEKIILKAALKSIMTMSECVDIEIDTTDRYTVVDSNAIYTIAGKLDIELGWI